MAFTFAYHVSVTETNNGMVLLDQRAGRYWQLNRTGAVIVRELLDGSTVPDVITKLNAAYPGAAERVPADVTVLLESLRSAGVISS